MWRGRALSHSRTKERKIDLQFSFKIYLRHTKEIQNIFLSGHFAYIDGPYKAQLQSTLLPWKPLYQSLGLCLRYKYLMPSKSKSTLKVFVRESNRENPLLVWRLVGYHGEEWSAAQMALPVAKGFQVRKNRNWS